HLSLYVVNFEGQVKQMKFLCSFLPLRKLRSVAKMCRDALGSILDSPSVSIFTVNFCAKHFFTKNLIFRFPKMSSESMCIWNAVRFISNLFECCAKRRTMHRKPWKNINNFSRG